MAVWIAPALALIATLGIQAAKRVVGIVGGSRAAQFALAAGGIGAIGAATGALGIPGVDLFPNGEEKRRRRRRRALSQGDRDDIAFIAATISSSAAGKFAVMLATRAR